MSAQVIVALVFMLFLAACATLPAPDVRKSFEARCAELTAKYNNWAGTSYDVPSIDWYFAPCGADGDEEGNVVASRTVTMRTATGITVNEILPGPGAWSISLNQACLSEHYADMISNTLPHELAHLFVNKTYGPSGHDYHWQFAAIILGVPKTDPYITDKTLRTTEYL